MYGASPEGSAALVTPRFLKRVDDGRASEEELSELLARDVLIPVVHGTTYDEVRKGSPLLGSRHGSDTADDSMEVVARKSAELVDISDLAPVG